MTELENLNSLANDSIIHSFIDAKIELEKNTDSFKNDSLKYDGGITETILQLTKSLSVEIISGLILYAITSAINGYIDEHDKNRKKVILEIKPLIPFDSSKIIDKSAEELLEELKDLPTEKLEELKLLVQKELAESSVLQPNESK